jgi:hypothetical protein
MKLLEILYPVGLKRNDCRFIIQRIFDAYRVPAPVNSLEVGTVNDISYNSDYWNIHPAIIMATMMMEQDGVFTKGKLNPPVPLTTWECQALCGVVNQDEKGTARTDLLGIGRQTYRTAMGYSWSLGVTPDVMFGRSAGWRLSWPRFMGGMTMQLEDEGHPFYTPKDAVEYALLKHCPHIGRLADAQEHWNTFISFFQ